MTSAKFLAEAFWKYNHVSRLRKYFQCGKRHSKVLSAMVLVYNYAFNDFQFLSIGGMVSVTSLLWKGYHWLPTTTKGNSGCYIQVLNKEVIVGERLRQLDRYKEAVERAERLREAGKLPKTFDWSRLDSEDSGADMEELVSD